jgi:hypothetical protein
MSKPAYVKEIERQYGAASRFVQRALDSYRNMVSFYEPTPNQCICRLLDHLERVTALGGKVITAKQRENARDAIFKLIERAQEYDAMREECDSPHETPSGGAEQLYRMQGMEATGLGSRQRFHDSERDPTMRHCRPDLHDERVHFGDPVRVLSRYRIRASEGLRTYLTPDQDEQFALNEQEYIMDRLRRLEYELARSKRREVRATSPYCPA